MLSGLVPDFLVPAVRGAMQSQGYPPEALLDSGDFDFQALASGTYDTATFWTRVTPPVGTDLAALLSGGEPNPLLVWLQPTIRLTGPRGTQIIAPYGTAPERSLLNWAGPAVALAGAGGLLWWLLRSRRGGR